MKSCSDRIIIILVMKIYHKRRLSPYRKKSLSADDEGCQTGVGRIRSRAVAGLEQSKSGAELRAGQERGRNRAGAKLSRVKQSRAERGQEVGRNWV